MPAAVATGIPINGPLKNKKIVFDDEGEAVSRPNKKEQKQKQRPQQGKKQQQQNGQQVKKPHREEQKQPHRGEFRQKKPQRIKFDEEGEQKEQAVMAKKPQRIKFDEEDEKQDHKVEAKKPQRIKFDEEGEEQPASDGSSDSDEDEQQQKSLNKKRSRNQTQAEEDADAQKKWYQVHPDYPSSEEFLDMKENEQLELFNLCKNAFEAEKNTYAKRNPSDSRWLQTALHKGTAKDRANAGALLVTSNPLGNLEALSTLIGFCKLSNKASQDVIAVLTDLWQEVLLPPQRKLLSTHTRGADWKHLKKQSLTKDQLRRIYSYWYFENELKDLYHEFLKNLMQGLQTGQEHNKNSSIVAGARLLAYAPEKEQMLLTMLINKLGDPIAKIASKALHHLSEVAHKHPNMCGVIVAEAEKLLFRNNISERAQHFALCFLASIAPSGRAEVCTKLVNICFALFKVLVQKGAVNNRTMQAILRCLQKAIVEAQPPKDNNGELLTKEMQDTVYRLVHLADIRVSVQTLGLLLQLVTAKSQKSDRFYNALYVKLLDLNLINVGGKTAAQLLHIVHRAIHLDPLVARAQAFVKRLLQLALYAPPPMAAGCLIVLHKLLRMRRELIGGIGLNEEDDLVPAKPLNIEPQELDKFGSDEEEVYEDVKDKEETEVKPETGSSSSSWHHKHVAVNAESKVRNIDNCKYDPYHRVPAYAGAGYALRHELLLLCQHYHPTVQVFAEQILSQKRMDYYGDPLRDFGLPHFLERFAFKNPKKLDQPTAESTSVAHKRYMAQGGRGKPVKSLTKGNCTEDEMFIFNFLEHKRRQAELLAQSKKPETPLDQETEGADDLKEGEVDDDEFEAYLDGYFGKKSKDAAEEEDELNYLQELGGEMQLEKDRKKDKKKKKQASEQMEEEMDDDWGDNEDDDDDELEDNEMSEVQSDDETGSIDLEPLDDDDDDDDEADSSEAPESPDELEDEDEDEAPPKSKKSRSEDSNMLNERGFAQKLKHSNDMSSLFAAADDFSALLEETGKSKGQGTSNAVFNKDKSSDKQMKWEEKRRSNSKNYTSKKFSAPKSKTGKAGHIKKRKH